MDFSVFIADSIFVRFSVGAGKSSEIPENAAKKFTDNPWKFNGNPTKIDEKYIDSSH